MGKDISTMYTKDKNIKAGRRGWTGWKSEKVTAISPDEPCLLITANENESIIVKTLFEKEV